MLSKSAARSFFLIGTALCAAAFVLLTFDTLAQLPERTHADQLTDSAKRGFEIWTANNCMGCHTILGEGAYYAPELTQVYARRGPEWIKAFLKDPAAFYPGRRQMVKYAIFDPEKDKNADQNRADIIEWLQWVGNMETNGFPPKPDIIFSGAQANNGDTAKSVLTNAPVTFTTICMGCHKLAGKGGVVGPALDGVGRRLDAAFLKKWIHDPQAVKKGTAMPKLPLTDAQIDSVVVFLGNQK